MSGRNSSRGFLRPPMPPRAAAPSGRGGGGGPGIAASPDGSIGGSSATACGCCPITGLMKQASYGNYSQAAPIGIIEPTIVTPPPPGSTPGGAFGFAPPSFVEFLPVTGAPGAHQTFGLPKEFGGRTVLWGAEPMETLAQAQTSWNLNARPILLPMGQPGGDFASIAVASAAPFPFALTLAAGFKTTVPLDWFVRAIVTCVQGTATPGPGAGSIGRLYALAHQEEDDVCSTR